MKTKNHVEPKQNFSIFGKVLKLIKMKTSKIFFFCAICVAVGIAFFFLTKDENAKRLVYSQPQGLSPSNCKYCSGPSTHAISFDSVLIMIKAFQEDPNFRGLNTGGYFSWQVFDDLVKNFNKSHNSLTAVPTMVFYPGIDFRYVYSDVLFTGIEIKDCDAQWNPCRQEFLDPSPEIYRPDHHTAIDFFSTSELQDRSSFESALREETPIFDPILIRNMRELRGSFFGSYYSYYPSALFAFQPEFVKNPLSSFPIDPNYNTGENSGFRYYFGIDNQNEEHKLRVLCCAVDSKGKIIVPKSGANLLWDQAFRESSRPRRP